MNSLFHPSLRIGLSRTSFAVLLADGWIRRRISVLADEMFEAPCTDAPSELAERLGKAIHGRRCSGAPVQLILADDMVRLFMVTPPHNAASIADLRAAAAMRFHALYGEAASHWRIEAEWSARHPFLACAVPAALLQALQQASDTHRLRLVSVLPHFIASWNKWCGRLPANAWFCSSSNHVLTLGVTARRRLERVRTVTVPRWANRDAQWLYDFLSHEALRLDLPLPASVYLCGDVPGASDLTSADGLSCIRLDKDGQAAAEQGSSAGIVLASVGGRT